MTPRARFRAAAILIGPIVALGLLAVSPVPICQSRALFGVPCPGCGLTRATLALLDLRFVESFRLHPLAPVVLGFLLLEMIRAARNELGRPPIATLEAFARPLPRAVLAVALIALFGFRLAGGLGGLPDRVDPSDGAFARAAHLLSTLPEPASRHR